MMDPYLFRELARFVRFKLRTDACELQLFSWRLAGHDMAGPEDEGKPIHFANERFFEHMLHKHVQFLSICDLDSYSPWRKQLVEFKTLDYLSRVKAIRSFVRHLMTVIASQRLYGKLKYGDGPSIYGRTETLWLLYRSATYYIKNDNVYANVCINQIDSDLHYLYGSQFKIEISKCKSSCTPKDPDVAPLDLQTLAAKSMALLSMDTLFSLRVAGIMRKEMVLEIAQSSEPNMHSAGDAAGDDAAGDEAGDDATKDAAGDDATEDETARIEDRADTES